MRILKCSLTVLVLLGISMSLSCCKEIGTANDTSANTIPPYSEVSLSFEEETTSAKREWDGYEYEVFNTGTKKQTIYLPIEIEDYITELENGEKRFLLRKLTEDYGWTEKDEDGNGIFELPKWDSGSFSYKEIATEGDYYYFDCGNMWIRLLMQNRYYFDEPSVLYLHCADYSFIFPDSPGEYYYEYKASEQCPTNNAIAIIDFEESDYFSTDYENTYCTYDDFVFFAYVITWPSIDTEGNPFFYLDYSRLYEVEDVRNKSLRDKYWIE